MMRRMIFLVAVVGMAMVARGQATRPGVAPAGGPAVDSAAVLAPYIDEQTVLVAHADASKIDTGAIEKFATELMDEGRLSPEHEARMGLKAARLAADAFLARFKQLGGRHVYLLMRLSDVWPNMQPLAVLLPIEPGGDPNMMMEFLKATAAGDAQFTTAVLKENLLFAGMPRALEQLKSLKPVARPELALPSDAGTALEAVVAPTADMRRAWMELMPRLPEEIGGGSTDFLEKLVSLRVSVTLPPEATVRLSFVERAATPDAAAFPGVLVRLRDVALASKRIDDDPSTAAEVRALVRELTTATTAAAPAGTVRSTVQVDAAQMRRAARILAPAVAQAQQKSERMASVSKIKQVLVACIIYADDHQGTLPESLKTLTDAKLLTEDGILNPGDPKRRPYEYRRWAGELNKIPDVANTPLVWETVDDETGAMAVGFVDGHVMIVRNRKELDALLEKAKQAMAGR